MTTPIKPTKTNFDYNFSEQSIEISSKKWVDIAQDTSDINNIFSWVTCKSPSLDCHNDTPHISKDTSDDIDNGRSLSALKTVFSDYASHIFSFIQDGVLAKIIVSDQAQAENLTFLMRQLLETDDVNIENQSTIVVGNVFKLKKLLGQVPELPNKKKEQKPQESISKPYEDELIGESDLPDDILLSEQPPQKKRLVEHDDDEVKFEESSPNLEKRAVILARNPLNLRGLFKCSTDSSIEKKEQKPQESISKPYADELIDESDLSPDTTLFPVQPPQKKRIVEMDFTLDDDAIEIEEEDIQPKSFTSRLEVLKQFFPDFKDDILKFEEGKDPEFIGKITVQQERADDLVMQLQICLDEEGGSIYCEKNTVYITTKKLLNRLSIHLDKLV